MKKKIVSLLMLTLLLISALGSTLIINPSLAKENENTLSNEDFTKTVNEKTVNSNTQKSKDSQASRGTKEGWNFNDTNAWKNFTYTNGDKTRLIVGLEEENPESLSELAEIAAKYQAEIVNTISIRGRVKAAVVELSFASVAAFAQDTKIIELASYVEPNMKVQTQWVPNDPYWTNQWGPQKIEADWAWNITTGSSEVLVAIVDTGIDYTHPDLAANYAPLGFDWVNMDADPKDDFGHGTHCAGIVAAVLNNSIGVAGLAQVRIMSEKVLSSGGYGYADWVANGIIHATESGADIISMSLGGYGDSELVHSAVKYAYDSGVLIVAAAGNDNTNMKSYPAGYDEVIAVAATDQYDNKAYFSNWGDWIELAAPGVDIYSTMPTYWVTMNDYGFPINYAYASGTSMACPHVSGLAALVLSLHPEKSRDWLRLWLRYTADDLGSPGFDVYYGYGRINARKAVEQTPPEHELIAYAWQTPPYVKPGTSETINATILNFGEYNETDVVAQLFANDTLVNSTVIDFLASGNATTITLTWSPVIEGLYNVTLYITPVQGETSVDNNMLSKSIYVGTPVKAVVLHSAGNVYGEIITNWQVLSSEWYLFGDKMVYVDYITLNKEGITYEDITATEADVLIISCAYDPYSGWQFTDAEIEAIALYIHEGHGLIVTAGTLYYAVPNNNKLARLIGINENITYDAVGTDLLHLLNTTHPLFKNVPNPFVFAYVGTAIPSDGRWDSNELIEGKYLALGHYQESAIVTYKGLVYISPWLEIIPAYYRHHLQLLYNAILWSRYPKPEHELTVSLETPKHLKPNESTLLNATVSNKGLNNETNVELQLIIDGALANSVTIPELLAGSSYTLSYLWTPTTQGMYNITAYAPPVLGEELTTNNLAKRSVIVLFIAVKNVLVYTDDYYFTPSLRYTIVALDNLGINYTHYADDPWGFGVALTSQPWDLVIVDHCNYYALGSYWTEIEEYVRNGGFLVLSTFDIDGSNSEPTTLWNTLWVQWVSDMWSPESVYRWDPSHSIFTFPNTVGDLTSYIEGYADDGDHVIATTGTSIAGFTMSPTEGYAAIVVGNTYPTVLFTYILDEFRYDQDDDGKLDAIELWENAIFYLAKGYEHDLAVSLDVPKVLELGDSTLLNATVQNRGANNETDVELQLFINDTVVDSLLIPELATDTSFTFSYSWIPTVEGGYNITVYARPVLGEEFTKNNVIGRSVEVKILPDILIVADDDASYKIRGTSLPEFEYALMFNGYEYFVWQESSMGRPPLEFLLKFKLVIWTCGDYWGWAVDSVDAETLEAYLAMGGNILLEGEDIGYDHYMDSFMVNVAHAIYQVDNTGAYGLTVTDPTHPVTQGLPTTFTWLQDPPYDDGVFPTNGGFEVIRYTDTLWTAVTVYDGTETGYGSVVYYAFPIYCLWQSERDTLIINSVGWLAPSEHDLKVSLAAPTFLELGNSTLLNATVQNRGLNNEINIEFSLIINGTVVYSTIIEELPVGNSYSINYLWAPSETGSHNVTVYASPVPGETNIANNVVTRWTHVFFYRRSYISHQWVGGGSSMGWHGDDMSWQYTLPFDFPFYEVNYKTIYISSNGLITFTSPDASPSNSVTDLSRKLAIAVAWDDWITNDPYDIYVWKNSTHVGIRWFVRAYGSTTTANFEAILSREGIIQCNYASCDGLVTATIGISNGAGHIIAEDITNLDFIHTIIFSPYLSRHDVAVVDVVPSANEVRTGESVNIDVVVENQGNFTEDFTVTLYALEQLLSTSTAHTTLSGYPTISVINPGPDGYPGEWTAGPPRYLGTSDFIFYSNETSVGAMFFINVTVYDVERIKAWQIGIIYDSSILEYVSAWRPSDHVFKPVEEMGWPLIAPPPADDYFNATHKILKWGCTYLMPEGEEWSFNGTGQLSQIQFKIIKEVNETYPIANAWLSFDPEWTSLYQHPLGVITPQMKSGYFEYSLPTAPPPPKYVIGIVTAYGLEPGERIILSFLWNTSDIMPGNYMLLAEATGVVYDEDPEDNVYYDGIIVVVPGVVRDIAIIDIVVPSNKVYQGWVVNITVTVANLGNATENFTVTLYYDSVSVSTETVYNLEPNASTQLIFSWNTTHVPYCHNYTIKAVASALSGEIDVDNNTLVYGSVKVKMMGDINGDEKVSMEDIMLTVDSFGSYPAHPRWLFDADLDQDGRITMGDIVLVLLNFGSC